MNERERARICFFLRNTGKKFTDIINSTKHQGQGEKSTEKNEQCYVPHQKKNEQYACVTVESDRGFGGHLVGDGRVGGGGEVEALEVLAAGRVPAAGVGVRGQRGDERAAHGAERLHLRRVQPVRVPLAPSPPQQWVAPPPTPCRRRLRLLLRRHYQLLLAGVCGDLPCSLPCWLCGLRECVLTRVRIYGCTRFQFAALV